MVYWKSLIILKEIKKLMEIFCSFGDNQGRCEIFVIIFKFTYENLIENWFLLILSPLFRELFHFIQLCSTTPFSTIFWFRGRQYSPPACQRPVLKCQDITLPRYLVKIFEGAARLLLATLIFDSIWNRKVRFWSKVTPKSFSLDTASITN